VFTFQNKWQSTDKNKTSVNTFFSRSIQFFVLKLYSINEFKINFQVCFAISDECILDRTGQNWTCNSGAVKYVTTTCHYNFMSSSLCSAPVNPVLGDLTSWPNTLSSNLLFILLMWPPSDHHFPGKRESVGLLFSLEWNAYCVCNLHIWCIIVMHRYSFHLFRYGLVLLLIIKVSIRKINLNDLDSIFWNI